MSGSSLLAKEQYWLLTSIIAILVVILAGSVVRVSGSGMGCPDWPTCFGQLIPPTDISQLPVNFRQIYGFLEHEQFNPIKTWTEYLNRLVGLLGGIVVLITAVVLFFARKKAAKSFYSALAAVLLVGFNGWLGSKVVSTHLLPSMVSLHMFAALGVLFLLTYSYFQALVKSKSISIISIENVSPLWIISLVLLAMLLVQIYLGTQVRGVLDTVKTLVDNTENINWDAHFPSVLKIHRSFSIIYLFSWAGLLVYFYIKTGISYLTKVNFFLLMFVVLTVASGSILNHLQLVQFVRPMHLLFSNIAFIWFVFMVFNLNYLRVNKAIR